MMVCSTRLFFMVVFQDFILKLYLLNISVDFQNQVFILLLISMKFSTRIINEKSGYRSAIAPFMSGFFRKIMSFLLLINLTDFFESFITTVTRKLYSIAIRSCFKWTFLQSGNFLTQTPC